MRVDYIILDDLIGGIALTPEQERRMVEWYLNATDASRERVSVGRPGARLSVSRWGRSAEV